MKRWMRRPGVGELVRLGVAAAILSSIFAWAGFGGTWRSDPPTQPTGLIAEIYDPPSRPIEEALNKGDGQIFALQATDPALRRMEQFGSPNPADHAYRWQRPLYGWLGWAASLGQPRWVPEALVGLTVLSAVGLTLAVGAAVRRAGGDSRWALVVVLLPGVIFNLTHVGPETFATALLVVGWSRWRGAQGARWAAIGLFALAGLARETSLVVPAALAVAESWPSLRRRRWRQAWDASWRLATAALPLVIWVAFLRVRIGVLPEPNNEALLTPVPFSGLLAASSSWSAVTFGVVCVMLVPSIVAVVRARESGLRMAIGGFLLLGAFTGELPWSRSSIFGRVFLPMVALSLLVILPELQRRVAGEQVEPAVA